jgi:beta-glucosidase
LPDPESALFPEGFHKVERYIYPWIDSVKGIKKPKDMISQPQSPLSDAGGGPGGNPDLYTTLLTVSASLANIGERRGSAVVQLYISFPKNYKDHETGEPVDFPVRVLRGFEKVQLAKDSNQLVKFEVTRRDLSYWDVKRQNWVLPNGEFGIEVGFSSRDFRLVGKW